MDPLSIIADNLRDDSERLRQLIKRLPAYADDLATHLLGRDTDEASDEELELSYRAMKEVLADEQTADGFSVALTTTEEALLSAEIIKILREKAKITTFLQPLSELDGKCVYFRNAYSDEAYRLFSRYLTDPIALYAENPSAACRELYADAASFAILPTVSKNDGIIGGIQKLILRYELAPVLFTTVKTPSSDEALTLGLYAAAPIAIDRPEGLDALFFAAQKSDLSSLLTAADYLGASLLSMSSDSDTQGFLAAYRLRFAAKDPEALEALRLLLLCEYPHHQLLGLYKTIQK